VSRVHGGWKIAKDKTSKKIDAIVALVMAAVAALDEGNVQVVDIDPQTIRDIQREAGLIPGDLPDRASYQEEHIEWEDLNDA
jgi:flagellar biosynthesis/type III secretory pathway M-ring protein FliF/YscJ